MADGDAAGDGYTATDRWLLLGYQCWLARQRLERQNRRLQDWHIRMARGKDADYRFVPLGRNGGYHRGLYVPKRGRCADERWADHG